MIISSFSLTEASLALVSVLGAFGVVIKSSKCKKINCCRVIECTREVEEPVEEDSSVITRPPE